MKRLFLAAAAVLALSFVAAPAFASPTPSPSVSASSAHGFNPGSCNLNLSNGCVAENFKWTNSYWAYSSTNNNWYASTSNQRKFLILGANQFQHIQDEERITNQCLTLVWSNPAKMIQDHTCGNASTQQWRFTQVDPMLNEWLIDNQWLDNNMVSLCPGNYNAVMSILGGGPTGTLQEECADAGTGNAGPDQIWLINTIAP